MEFKGLKCPVCDKPFEDGDDIVVCPECGAAHHRECWEIENQCAYADKHGEDFEYEEESDTESDTEICKRCGAENAKNSFYCSKCGAPMNMESAQNYNQYQNQNQTNSNPFSAAFDPMAGVNPEEDMGGVTAGEIAKYVGNNTPYFIRVFNRIKLFGRGRFSFCGFIFSGFYLLYRKMYKIGAIIAAAVILLMITETYIQYSSAYTAFENAIKTYSTSSSGYLSGYANILTAYSNLEFGNQVMIFIMMMCSSLRLGIQIVVGIFANRWYFRHCRTEVKKIKDTSDNPNQTLESKGGVNLALALSIGAINAAIYLIPMFVFGY